MSGAEEMIPWLLGWGAGIEVLEPEWLRQALAGRIEETLSCTGPGEKGSREARASCRGSCLVSWGGSVKKGLTLPQLAGRRGF